MTQDLSNQRRVQLELQQLRRNEAIGNSVVIGYEDEFGVPRAFQGDEDSAYVKLPPFPSDAAPWATFVPLPAVAAGYVFTPALDVAKERLLAVWFDYVPTVGGGPLSVVAQAARDLATLDFFPIAVINPTITIVTPPAPFAPGFGSRDFFPAELRTNNSFAARTVFPFDVSPYVAFRLGVVDLAVDPILPGSLTLFYSFAT